MFFLFGGGVVQAQGKNLTGLEMQTSQAVESGGRRGGVFC